jgi:hypothetical protein
MATFFLQWEHYIKNDCNTDTIKKNQRKVIKSLKVNTLFFEVEAAAPSIPLQNLCQ